MRAYQAKDMADSKADLLAGAGGLVTDEAQSEHQGRKALLLVRNNEDCDEFIALAKTMGINIIDRVDQRGRSDAKWFMGQGKLQDARAILERTSLYNTPNQINTTRQQHTHTRNGQAY